MLRSLLFDVSIVRDWKVGGTVCECTAQACKSIWILRFA